MPMGPGRYDELAMEIRKRANCKGLVLAIFDGDKGCGFEVNGPADILFALPKVLRQMADSVEKDIASIAPGTEVSN